MSKKKKDAKIKKPDAVKSLLKENAFNSGSLSNLGEEQDACDV